MTITLKSLKNSSEDNSNWYLLDVHINVLRNNNKNLNTLTIRYKLI